MTRRGAVVGVFTALAAALPFTPALGGGFLDWDDRTLLVHNPRWLGADGLRWILTSSSGGAFGPYQPLTWISYRLDHALWGLDPRAFHVTNVLLHALTAVVLAGCARRLLARALPRLAERPRVLAGAACAAALLWAVHPLRVEAVAWITERRSVLSGLLLALSLRAWLGYVDAAPGAARTRAYAASLACAALSLLAKSSALAWPLVLLVLDVAPLGRRGARRLLLEKLPFAAVSALVGLAAWRGQVETGAFAAVGALGRCVLAGYGAAFLALRTALPFGLHAHVLRPQPFDALAPQFAVPACLAAAATVVVLARARRAPGSAAAWAAALLLLAPVSGLVPIGSHATADRYTYLPAFPLVLGVVGLVAQRWSEHPRRLAAAACAALLALGVTSARLAATWTDTRALFARVVAFEPGNWLAHGMLAELALADGDVAGAREHAETAVRLHETPDALARLGWIALQGGDAAGARAALERALARDAAHEVARIDLAILEARAGDLSAAETELRRVLAQHPDSAQAHYNLALVLHRTGRDDAAREAARAALRLEPGYAAAAALLAQLGG